jgi:hypothetical protein
MVVVPVDCITVYAADPDNKDLVTSVKRLITGVKSAGNDYIPRSLSSAQTLRQRYRR